MHTLTATDESMAKANHSRDKVRALQRALYVAAKANSQRRFHALYDRMADLHTLRVAWERVRRNRGAAGIDGKTLDDVEAYGVDRFLIELRAALLAKQYRPLAVRRVSIPKPGKRREQRPLGIPVVRDRVVQASAKLVLEPIFEAGFRECSYGFRPRRSAQQAVERVRWDVNFGKYFVVDVDIADFFGSLDHTLLLRLVARRISDRRVLRLIRLWLKAGVMEAGVTISSLAGVPQGGVISPLLANIYGHVLDALWEKEAAHLGTMIRYADDMVVLCQNEQSATLALEWLHNRTRSLHLRLHPEKSRVVCLVKGSEGFDFLGFHFHLSKSRQRGKWYCYRWPSQRAMAAIRTKVRAITAPRYKLTRPIQDVVAELNPVMRGWGTYFRIGNSSRKFVQIDSYVRLRLGLFDMHKRRRRGWWRLRYYHRRWCRQLGTYILTGTVRYATSPTAAT